MSRQQEYKGTGATSAGTGAETGASARLRLDFYARIGTILGTIVPSPGRSASGILAPVSCIPCRSGISNELLTQAVSWHMTAYGIMQCLAVVLNVRDALHSVI